jgi:hypothetical protein
VVVKHLACDLSSAGKVFPGHTVRREAFRGILKG